MDTGAENAFLQANTTTATKNDTSDTKTTSHHYSHYASHQNPSSSKIHRKTTKHYLRALQKLRGKLESNIDLFDAIRYNKEVIIWMTENWRIDYRRYKSL